VTHFLKVGRAKVLSQVKVPSSTLTAAAEREQQIEKVLISLIIGSSEGGFRSRDERKRAENM
jgi:hypothetical protein